MTPAAALFAAGTQSRLVARPRGVAHVYVGRLTPSGRRVPRGGRTVCHAATGVLYVVADRDHLLDPGVPRLCRRCATCLGSRVSAPSFLGGGHHPDRGDWATAYRELTPFHLAVDAYLAETPAEVDRVRFLGLLLLGWRFYTTEPIVSPEGKASPPLHKQVRRATNRVGTPRDPWFTRLDQIVAGAREQATDARRRRGRDIAEDRQRDALREGRYVPSWSRPA